MTTEAPRKKTRARAPKHCAICGTVLKPEKWIYSTVTGERFCPVPEWTACADRAERRRSK